MPPVTAYVCAGRIGIRLGNQSAAIKAVIKIGATCTTATCRDLYFFLIYRNSQFASLLYCSKLYFEARSRTFEREQTMLDLVMLAIGLGFFALSIGYAVACDRL